MFVYKKKEKMCGEKKTVAWQHNVNDHKGLNTNNARRITRIFNVFLLILKFLHTRILDL